MILAMFKNLIMNEFQLSFE